MRPMPELEVREMAVADLVPYANNAKKHPREQIDQIAESISQFGNCDPIAVWHNEDGQAEIVEGHGRVMALKQLGIDTAPVIFLDHLTDEQRRAYTHVHNQTTLSSGFDYDALVEDMDNLDMDWEALGFQEFLPNFEHEESAADDVPEVVECRAKPGDIWQCGSHRVMCGSSANVDDMAALMGGVKADAVFTDPPYGVAIGSKNAVLNTVAGGERYSENIEGDTMGEQELYDLLVDCMSNVRECCKDDASYYVTSPQGGSLGLMMMMMKDAGLPVRHVLMWKKNIATFSLGRLDYDYQHEPMFYTWTKKHRNHRKSAFRTTVWEIDKPQKCDLHPTMKPVELVENVLLDATEEGEVVLDAFGGSGTTMIAAENLGRSARLMELDPHYCDVIIARWEEMTGQHAVLAER